jgi:hypothetical protein
MVFKTEYKHLVFQFIEVDHKLKKVVYLCVDREGEVLGVVRWFPDWNQYVYVGVTTGIYGQSCLLDIADFIKRLSECVGA